MRGSDKTSGMRRERRTSSDRQGPYTELPKYRPVPKKYERRGVFMFRFLVFLPNVRIFSRLWVVLIGFLYSVNITVDAVEDLLRNAAKRPPFTHIIKRQARLKNPRRVD